MYTVSDFPMTDPILFCY